MDLSSLPTEFYKRLVLFKSIIGQPLNDFDYKATIFLPNDVKQKLGNLLKVMNSLNVTCKKLKNFSIPTHKSEVHYSGFLDENGTGLIPSLMNKKIVGARIYINGEFFKFLKDEEVYIILGRPEHTKDFVYETFETEMTLQGYPDDSHVSAISYQQQTKYGLLFYIQNYGFEFIAGKNSSYKEWIGFEPIMMREKFPSWYESEIAEDFDNERCEEGANMFIPIDKVPQEIIDNFIDSFRKIISFANDYYPEKKTFAESNVEDFLLHY